MNSFLLCLLPEAIIYFLIGFCVTIGNVIWIVATEKGRAELKKETKIETIAFTALICLLWPIFVASCVYTKWNDRRREVLAFRREQRRKREAF